MPAHNAQPFIAEAVHSVLRQTEASFKLWILENGSTDRTVQTARGFTDPRVDVFELGEVGFQGALEFGIRNAATPWLARMDADDLMFPDRLARQMQVLNANPELVFVGAHHSFLTPFGHIVDRLPFPATGPVDTARLATHRGFADPSVVFSRSVALEVGGMDPDFTIGDIALWFRLLSKGMGWQIGDPLHLYRLVPSSHSRASGIAAQCEGVWRKYVPSVRPKWAGTRQTPFWSQVAALELTIGDCNAVRLAARELEQSGEHREATRMRWRACLGRLGRYYYRFRNRHLYRHRPDLESSFGISACASNTLNSMDKKTMSQHAPAP